MYLHRPTVYNIRRRLSVVFCLLPKSSFFCSKKSYKQVDLDNIIGGSSTVNLDALISPRPGEKGAAPMDEGKVAEEGQEGE